MYKPTLRYNVLLCYLFEWSSLVIVDIAVLHKWEWVFKQDFEVISSNVLWHQHFLQFSGGNRFFLRYMWQMFLQMRYECRIFQRILLRRWSSIQCGTWIVRSCYQHTRMLLKSTELHESINCSIYLRFESISFFPLNYFV